MSTTPRRLKSHYPQFSDTRTPVSDADYQVPFRFNRKIEKLTFKLGPTKLTALEEKTKRERVAMAND